MSPCLTPPPERARLHNRDRCNLTHSMPYSPGKGHSVARHDRKVLVDGREVAWTVKNFALREGEMMLWPELVVQQAQECS